MHVLPIKCILQQTHDIVPHSVLRGEALSPSEERTRVKRLLLDGEGERETEVHDRRVGALVERVRGEGSGYSGGGRSRCGGGGGIGQEGVDGVGEVV